MPKTKADLEKDLKALRGKLSRATKRIASMTKNAAAEESSRTQRQLLGRKLKLAVDHSAALEEKLTAATGVCAALRKDLLKAKSLCGLVVTKIELSAWSHKGLQILGEEFVAEVKEFVG